MRPFDKLLYNLSLLEEKKYTRRSAPKSKFIKNTEEKRKERAKNVEILSENVEEVNKNITRYKFEVSSAEKSESDTHEVMLEVFNKSKRVDSCVCSCADFASRYARYRHDDGLNPWNERVKAKTDVFDPHNKDLPVLMNPDDNIGMSCKHITACIMKLEEKDS